MKSKTTAKTMNYQIEEIDLSHTLKSLNLSFPEELTFFPENLETANSTNDFVFTESICDINKLLKKESIMIETLGGKSNLYRSRKNADIYLPAIFFSLSLISENSTVVSISLNVLSNYISDYLKGSIGRKTAKIEFYLETKEKGKLKRIIYKGDAEGLKSIENIINTLK